MTVAALAESTDLKSLLEAFGLPPDTKAELGAMPGCFSAELDPAIYHSTPDTISQTGMRYLLRSPLHYKAFLDEPRDLAPNIGTATHAAILEPNKFVYDYTVYHGRRSGKDWDLFLTANPNKIILSETEMSAVRGMQKAVLNFEDFPLKQTIPLGVPEKSIFWIDPVTGVRCRIRIDLLTQSVIFDLKTVGDARPDGFLRQLLQKEYDLQSAMYTEGVKRFVGHTLPFIFICVETAAPHGTWLHPAGESILENGNRKFRRGLAAFQRLLLSNEWHGYRNAISTLELPKYAMLTPSPEEDAAYC